MGLVICEYIFEIYRLKNRVFPRENTCEKTVTYSIVPTGASALSVIRFPSNTLGIEGGLLADATGKRDMPSNKNNQAR